MTTQSKNTDIPTATIELVTEHNGVPYLFGPKPKLETTFDYMATLTSRHGAHADFERDIDANLDKTEVSVPNNC